MDYVLLLKKIKTDYNAEDKAVIAFGGSYGGMLAAWMRMKYPTTIQGAIAASAPVVAFKDAKTTDQYGFDDVVSRVFYNIDDGKCKNWIKFTFEWFDKNKADQKYWDMFNSVLKPCKNITDAQNVTDMI